MPEDIETSTVSERKKQSRQQQSNHSFFSIHNYNKAFQELYIKSNHNTFLSILSPPNNDLNQ